MPESKLLRSQAAAEYCGLSTTQLSEMRRQDRGPKYLSFSDDPTHVAYHKDDLDNWLSMIEVKRLSKMGAEHEDEMFVVIEKMARRYVSTCGMTNWEQLTEAERVANLAGAMGALSVLFDTVRAVKI